MKYGCRAAPQLCDIRRCCSDAFVRMVTASAAASVSRWRVVHRSDRSVCVQSAAALHDPAACGLCAQLEEIRGTHGARWELQTGLHHLCLTKNVQCS